MTIPPDLAPDEPLRLQSLRKLDLVETPIEERFERVTRLTKRLLGVEIVAISLVEADRQYFKSIQGLDACQTSRDVSFCGHAILGDDLMVVPDARQDARFAENPLVTGPPHIVFYASMPLRSVDGYKVGTLCVIDTKPRAFDADDQQLLRDLASMAEMELQAAAANAVQAALIEDVSAEQRRALIDPLTRMWNREGILELLRETIADVGTSEQAAALVLVDLDRFKQINVRGGHAAGDEVLRVTARRMLAALRESDLVGRIGGDEFLCVLSPCSSPAAAAEVVEAVRTRLTGGPIDTTAGPIDLTASFGIRFVPSGWTADVDELIGSAVAAMYDCKGRGRDDIAIVSGDEHGGVAQGCSSSSQRSASTSST